MDARRRSLFGLAGAVLAGVALMQGVGAWSRAALGARAAAGARPGDIHMIGSVDCVYCAAARAWFARHGVPYDECLVERDPACAARWQALGAPGTPLLLVRGRRVVGFDAEAIVRALDA